MGKVKAKVAPPEVDYSLSPITLTVEAHAELLTIMPEGDPEWLSDAVPLLLTAKMEAKTIETLKEEKCRPTMILLDSERGPYLTLLKILKKAEEYLKARLLTEYPGMEPIEADEGVASFKSFWRGTVERAADVPMDYWSPDIEKIQVAVTNGLRSIPGVKITKERTVVATPKVGE